MTISNGTIGVGVVGLGVGEQHAQAFNRHPACEVRKLYDVNLARAHSVVRSIPGCAVASELAELLEDPRLDVMVIASFDDAHYSQVIAALDAGKHVFVEKPMCRTMQELSEIKRRWESAGGRLKLWSNLVLRAAPLYSWLHGDGMAKLGEVYAFDGDYLYGRLHKIAEGWRKNIDDYSVMEGGGVHLVDLMLWFTRERPLAVVASGNRLCTRGTQFRYNDFMAATFEFSSGLIGRITANFGCVHRHQHVVRIFGTRGTFLYDDAGGRLHSSRDPSLPAEQLTFAPLPAHKGALVGDFVSAVLDNTDDSRQTQSFFDGISVCLAADRAVTSGKKERVQYV